MINVRGNDFLSVSQRIDDARLEIQKPQPKKEKKHKCDQCARTYIRRYHLTRHQKYHCGMDPHFICDYCGKKLRRKQTILNHILQFHMKLPEMKSKRIYKCGSCDRFYSSPGALWYHNNVQHSSQYTRSRYSCEYCYFQTFQKSDLSRHMLCKHLK